MKTMIKRATFTAALAMLLPLFSYAQGVAADLHSLQGVLNSLYDQMMPLCSGMIGVARGIGGFAALWYIGSRVWKHIAAAEPVDIYPLLRPFALGFCILIFPSVLALINGFLQPTVTATQGMVTGTNAAIERMLDPAQTDPAPTGESLQGDPEKYQQYTHPDNSGSADNSGSSITDAFSGWSIKSMVRRWIAELLNILFEAAALCIGTIRTFKLIVLAILGPICFGLSIFDDFQHTLKQWLARYVNVYMWLPVANIFGAIIAKVQENMIQLSNSGNLHGNDFGNTNTAYLIFLVIGIVGYFTVPSIANYIVNVGGHALFSKTSALSAMAMSYVSTTIMQGMTSKQPQSQPSQNDQPGNFQRDKLKGSNT
jgi:conjugative transposon TraJ protein